MKTMKKNNLRFWYLIYLIVMTVGLSIIVTLTLKLGYYQSDVVKIIFTILLLKFILQIIYFIYLLIKVIKKEIDENSDERERFIILRTAAVGGIVAFTLGPIVYIFLFVIPKYLFIAVIVYLLLIDAAVNISVSIYQKRI